MKHVAIILMLIIKWSQSLLGQTEPTFANDYRKVYKIKQGRRIYVQHISDAPGEVTKCRVIDLNDSLITLKTKANLVIIFPNNEIVGCWVIDAKAKAKMVVKGAIGLTWFFVGVGLSAAYYGEEAWIQAINITAMTGGLYAIYQANPKANATKVNLSKDKIYFKRHAY